MKSGELVEAEFDKKWRVVELWADGETVEESDVPMVNSIGEETFF